MGPFRGGRVVAVAGDPSDPQTYYFGSTGGGVWKTTDGGLYWRNVSDGYFGRASVGGLAVAPSDPTVIYAGMGEATIRGNVSHGDGVYKSTDAGQTWSHLGLAATRNIAKVRVDPRDADVVYVAALGHAHGSNPERGIFRSRDGGATWDHVLERGPDIGACDLALDATNPRILYAAFWRARRVPHALQAGGEGCGLFKSADGGDTWTEITRNHGLPKGAIGKIGVTASAARPGRVWAIVEAKAADEGGVYRSDNGGETWERMTGDRTLLQRPWYYQHIHADPQDPETVWVLSVRLWRSTDGGRTFAKVPIPHGDNHDLWIDPRNSRRIIEGNDGGGCVTTDGGASWSSIYNQPTAELYHITTDMRTPYRVYGAQQDNTTISVPSRSDLGAITPMEYTEIGGGESGYIAIRPDDPDIIYAGSYQGYLTRLDQRTGHLRDITVWPEFDMGWPASAARERFQWTFPVHLSPHDPNTLYTTGNRVFRSTDEGGAWEPISPDLSRADTSRLGDSGGPITLDNCGTEYYGTVFAFAESPVQRGVLWAGTDDGLVHISRDSGAAWRNVTPPELPEWSLVSIIEPSPHDPAVAYVAANRYKLDDFQPFLLKTTDYGATWTRITAGLPDDVFARAIREDPERRGLLYAGTEAGVWVSFDDGAHWESLRLNLPVVPVHDLVVKGSDLVVATHGRSCWILDDLTPLRQMNDRVRESAVHLFAPRPAMRFAGGGGYIEGGSPAAGVNYVGVGTWSASFVEMEKPDGERERIYLNAGKNPHDGAYITYHLKEKPKGEAILTVLDAAGTEIRSFTSEERKVPTSLTKDRRTSTAQEIKRETTEPKVPVKPGLNRFFWDLRYPGARPVDGFVTGSGELSGPVAPPGRYQVRLTVGGKSWTEALEVREDPRVTTSADDLRAQFELLLRIRDSLSAAHEGVATLRAIRDQVAAWVQRTEGQPGHDAVAKAGEAVRERLEPIERELIETHTFEDDDTLQYGIRLNVKLAILADVVGSGHYAPTRQAREAFAMLSGRVDEQLTLLRAVISGEVAAFNDAIRDARLPAVVSVAPQSRVTTPTPVAARSRGPTTHR
ncbi:MAG TPA: hypothetical protein VIC85_14660 [Ktedonobacterales bacterium]